jgi:hypothetical protein
MAYKPSPWQAKFHACDVFECLGAGAAGPGKTTALIADPLTQVNIEAARIAKNPLMATKNPNSRLWKLIVDNPLRKGESKGWALLLRREQKSLAQLERDALLLYKSVDPGVTFNVNLHTFTFTSGYRIQMGHCQNPNDWQMYFGFELTWLGFDELITFEQEQYDQIKARVRSSDPVLMYLCRVRSTSNPVMKREATDSFTVTDPQWVRRRFVDECPTGNKILTEQREAPDGRIVEEERIFLPATLYDNPNKEFVRVYERNLLFRKKHIRDALLFGRWDIVVGAYFEEEWDEEKHVLRPFRVPRNWAFFRSMDWGFREPGCVHWWALSPDEVLFCIKEFTFKLMRARQVAREIRAIERKMGLWDSDSSSSGIMGVADDQLWEERGDEGLGKAAEMLDIGIHWEKADKVAGSRRRNAELIQGRLMNKHAPKEPPRLYIFNTCVELIRCFPLVQTSHKDPEAPADQPNMHWMDSASYGVHFAEKRHSGIAALETNARERDPEGLQAGDNGYGGF